MHVAPRISQSLYLAVLGYTWLYLAYRIKRENGKIDQAKKSHLMGWNGIYHGYWCRHHHRSMHYLWEGQVLTGKLS